MIPLYPELKSLTLEDRQELVEFCATTGQRISEFTFANIYRFRNTHQYRLSRLPDGSILIAGADGDDRFFMLPAGPVDESMLKELFCRFNSMKCVPEQMAEWLEGLGYRVCEDRDNFDYLFLTEELSTFSGRKMHRKKNLYNRFVATYRAELRPIGEETKPDVLKVLEGWRSERTDRGDYDAAREAVALIEVLGLEGTLCYIDGNPSAYILGEPHPIGDTFLFHFRKALRRYTGIAEFVLKNFAKSIKERFRYINMEQDLGKEGLRRAKLGFRPMGFVKKFRAYRG